MSCRRNAFVVLCNIDRPLAVDYLQQVLPSVPTFDELLQLAVLELIRKDSKASSAHKSVYIRCVSELLTAASHSVKYEAANILMVLTSNPAAVKGTSLFFHNWLLLSETNILSSCCHLLYRACCKGI